MLESLSEYNCSTMEPLNDSTSFSHNLTNCTGEINNSSTTVITIPFFVRSIQAVVYIIVFILGLSLSVFLLFLILCSKSLHQRGFAVAVQILISNIAFMIPVLSTSAVVAMQGEWTLGDGTCHFIAFCNRSLQPQRWLLTTVLVIDRALTINRPLKYEKHGAKVVAIMSVVANIIAFLLGILPTIIIKECDGFSLFLNTCHFFTDFHPACIFYSLINGTIFLLIGGILPFLLYVWMFCKAKKANRQIVPTQQIQESTTITARFAVSQKQVLTIFLLFWTLLGCSLPYYLAFLFTFIASQAAGSLNIIIVGAFSLIPTQFLFYGLLIADPITIMWHKDVKQEVRKIKLKLHLTTSSTPST